MMPVLPVDTIPTPLPTNTAPVCPIWATAMVKRMAKRGAHVGDEFWGCMGYPAGRGTRSIG